MRTMKIILVKVFYFAPPSVSEWDVMLAVYEERMGMGGNGFFGFPVV